MNKVHVSDHHSRGKGSPTTKPQGAGRGPFLATVGSQSLLFTQSAIWERRKSEGVPENRTFMTKTELLQRDETEILLRPSFPLLTAKQKDEVHKQD